MFWNIVKVLIIFSNPTRITGVACVSLVSPVPIAQLQADILINVVINCTENHIR